MFRSICDYFKFMFFHERKFSKKQKLLSGFDLSENKNFKKKLFFLLGICFTTYFDEIEANLCVYKEMKILRKEIQVNEHKI